MDMQVVAEVKGQKFKMFRAPELSLAFHVKGLAAILVGEAQAGAPRRRSGSA